jgi:para-aminobenzoate synthetase/4-amino-4-deoxychorismate lyase
VKTRILIDNARERPGAASLFENPREIIRAESHEEVARAIDAMEAALASGAHLAGFFSYELGYALEPRIEGLMPLDQKVPLLLFGVFDEVRILNGLEIEDFLNSSITGDYSLSRPELTLDEPGYLARFEKVKDYIAAGDIYQLNLTLKGRSNFSGDAVALYRDLRLKQPVSYAALIETDDFTVVSASPELFLQIDRGHALARPMKGTAARGLTLERDETVRRWLAADLKSRAENLMIVDLMRNDLGRVAKTGSVRVSDLFSVETYETLHQMTSGVEAQLKEGTGIKELLFSLFPPGSITGAPKVRAMEIISELESEPRGVYTGAIGSISPERNACFNVAIRTVTIFPQGQAEIGIGSGVVHDSQARAEYDECLLKMRFLTDPVRDFQLIETMLHTPQEGYALLGRHVDRLEASAKYFQYPFVRNSTLNALKDHASRLGDGTYRVRLLAFKDGSTTIAETALPEGSELSEMVYTVSRHTMASDDVFLYHKTTNRELYDNEWAACHDTLGSDEVIFLNERGEVTEGSRTNIFARIDGKLLTPSLACGLLPGTFRADMLASKKAEEAVLTLDDLARAETLYLGNSVRGLLPARELREPAARSAAS